MTLLIVHLSDAHLDHACRNFVTRANNIVSAALSPMLNYSHIHIVLSGDLANKDAPRDFEYVRQFVNELIGAVRKRVSLEPVVVVSPGNHDADFSGDQSVRDILVPSLRQNPAGMTAAVVSQVGRVLDDFRVLQRDLMPGLVECGDWYSTYAPNDGSDIGYILLNTSLMSMKKEEPAKLYFPIEKVQRIPAKKSIVVMHHPLGWFTPDNAREISQQMPSLCHLVLMGHEHVSVGHHVRDIYSGSSVFYLKANVLRESAHPEESAFQTIEIDVESGFTPRSYKWSDDAYKPWKERTIEGLVCWPENVSGSKLSFTQQGLRTLRSAGASYSHRRKANITLEDIFVWPNLRRLREDHDLAVPGVESLYDSKLLADTVESLPSILIVKGGEQTGKSALARMLTLQLCKRGYSPLLIAASAVSSWREKSLSQRLTATVDEMFGRDSRGEFEQLDPTSRVLIIDDFDLNQVTDGYFDGLGVCP